MIVGLTTAKAIALVNDKPLIAINHLEAHALTARLTAATPFPYCLFLASGGHTQILAVRGVGDYVLLGTTLDDAIGEAFDKTAKLLGLGYPGGPQVEKEAARGNATRFALPRPMQGRAEPDFSLSGLKTALRLEAEKIAPLSDQDVADLCASFQQAVVDVVHDRLRAGMRVFRVRYGTPTALVAAGGVAANEAIRKVLQRVAFEGGIKLVAPPGELCTDNGAMIAWAGAERLALGPDRSARRRAARALAAGRDRRADDQARADVAAGRVADGIRPHRGARRRRLGHRARQRHGARRPQGDAVGARRRRTPSSLREQRESKFLPGVRIEDRIAVTRDLAEAARARRDPAGGAGAGDALGGQGAGGSDRAAARRSSPAPRASSTAPTNS